MREGQGEVGVSGRRAEKGEGRQVTLLNAFHPVFRQHFYRNLVIASGWVYGLDESPTRLTRGPGRTLAQELTPQRQMCMVLV